MSKPLPHTPLEAQAREARTALDEPAPFSIVTTPMDDEWKRRFDEMYPTIDVLPAAREGTLSPEERRGLAAKRQRLVDGLLRFGGERVCLPAWEADLDAILERGRLFSPEGLVRRRGRTGECHANTAMLWRGSKGRIAIATGYYLSGDGMWRPHSWGLADTGGSCLRVVETTEPAVAYFGFVLDASEACLFAEANDF